jgi:Flp pilus assembly protein TadG
MVNVRTRKKCRRWGTASVEAAIVLPIILMVTFGAIKYGWLFLKTQQITNAARNGARMAALPDITDPNVSEMVISMLGKASIDANDSDITITPVSVEGNPAVNVSISIPSRKVDILPNFPWLPNWRNIDASVTMAKEGI